VVPVADSAAVAAALSIAAPSGRGAIGRGLARSYGDAAQNAGGTVIDAVTGGGAFTFDAAAGTVTACGGAGLDDILRTIVPAGWFVPVTPGTRYVTVGGALACDIHGKNHHADGSFARHVTEVTLHLPGGEHRTITPSGAPDLFWATAGGMGLTGLVTSVTFRLLPITSSRLLVDTRRTADLDSTMLALADSDGLNRYSVAFVDLLARGASLGRGVLTAGDFAPLDALSRQQRDAPYDYAAGQPLAAPPWAPPGLLNRTTIRAFNELWYRRAPSRREGELQTIPTFFHPLDAVRGWNRLYGRPGFVQHQTVVPFGQERALRAMVEVLATSGAASFLAVLKRFGAADGGPLSFPVPGWTLALDLPAGQDGLDAVLDRLDRIAADAGGRVYLAKDARLDPALVPVMYPRLDEWRTVQRTVDPAGVLQSDLDRRLDLTGRGAGREPRRAGAARTSNGQEPS
jgi:decaprenylphospho-beta-D-ribofuranose 2-oxidase